MRLVGVVTINVALGITNKNDCLLNYRGKTSVTRRGIKCQRWNANYPHEPKYLPKGHTNHNYCRNPDNDVKGPWCYTTDPDKRFDYCNIDDCYIEPDVKCWRPDHDFLGKVSRTRSGNKCQAWAKNRPHEPNYRPKNARSQKNYCRNPDGDAEGPWCYTTDPNVRFEFCDIPKCETLDTDDEEEFYSDGSSLSSYYSDDEDYDYSFDIATLLGMIIEAPGAGYEYDEYSGMSYDYNNTQYEDYATDKREHYDCQTLSVPEPGSDYVGDVSVSVSGRKCQNWLDQYPHKHDFGFMGNHNSCRNTHFDRDEAPQGVWCYTTDPNVRWEFCSQIPECTTATHDPVDTQCGVLTDALDVKWGHKSLTTVGYPSRLNSRGQILTGLPRRGRRSSSSARPMSWMEMMKNRNERQKETRIIGGEPAASGNWPWIVSIRLREGAKHFCGGTVVKHRWVLSAAHCFEQINAKHIFLTAGHLSKNHGKAKNELGYQANLAEVVISHDNYNSKTVYADIALIKTTNNWQFGDYVKPACVPERSFDPDDTAVCAIAGWGATDANSKVLNQATIPKFNWNRCQKLLDSAMVDKSQSCWGRMEGGVDTCQGDSGGPLVCISSGAWKVTGITSWGFGCGDAASPGIYTNVAKYNQWINYHTQ